MKLYHGSNLEIIEIDLKKSMVGKDFGQGFYLSADYSQAAKQANNTTFRKQEGKPTVTTFLFDEKLLDSSDLKVKIFEGYTEEWAEFILQNRSNKTSTPPMATTSFTVRLQTTLSACKSAGTWSATSVSSSSSKNSDI